jgi:hypothetical protein
VKVGDEEQERRGRPWRIEALRRFPGEEVERVLARRFEPTVVDENESTDITDDEFRWMERAVGAVRSVHRDFLSVVDAAGRGGHSARIQLLDEAASVAVEVGREGVSIIPLADYNGDAAAGFALMWQICQALTRDADCVIVDPSGIVVIEMELDAVRAREEYGWI